MSRDVAGRYALAIDPGLRCGFALGSESKVVDSGVWLLDSKRHSGAGMRFLLLEGSIREAIRQAPGEVIAVTYEEVRQHSGVAAAHVYGGIQAIIQKTATELEIPWMSIPVSAIKIEATGKGNARKAAVLRAARERWPAISFIDDNQADAVWLLANTWRRLNGTA